MTDLSARPLPVVSVVTGASYILRYLARLSSAVGGSSLSLYGATAEMQTQVDYFLDLAALCTNKDTLNKYAQLVNDHLAHRTVLVGERGLTIADLFVWEQLVGQSQAPAGTITHTQRFLRTVQLLVSCLQ